jgi:FkbM family methyltransferase
MSIFVINKNYSLDSLDSIEWKNFINTTEYLKFPHIYRIPFYQDDIFNIKILDLFVEIVHNNNDIIKEDIDWDNIIILNDNININTKLDFNSILDLIKTDYNHNGDKLILLTTIKSELNNDPYFLELFLIENNIKYSKLNNNLININLELDLDLDKFYPYAFILNKQRIIKILNYVKNNNIDISDLPLLKILNYDNINNNNNIIITNYIFGSISSTPQISSISSTTTTLENRNRDILSKFKNINISNNLLEEENVIIDDKKLIYLEKLRYPFYIQLHYHNDYISNVLQKYNHWEPRITELFIEIFELGNGIFLDIGANIGYYSLLAAKLNKNVIAFEPLADNYKIFAESIKKNKFDKQIKILPYAIGNKSYETVTMTINYDNMGASKISNLNNYKYKSMSNFVKQMRLDDITEIKNLKPYAPNSSNSDEQILLIKIDVEGYEPYVIESGFNLIANLYIPFLLIEITPTNEENTNKYAEMILNLTKLGYLVFDIGITDFGTVNYPTQHLVNLLVKNVCNVTTDNFDTIHNNLKKIKKNLQTNYFFIKQQ